MNGIIVTFHVRWNSETLKLKYNWLFSSLGYTTNKSRLFKDYYRATLVII